MEIVQLRRPMQPRCMDRPGVSGRAHCAHASRAPSILEKTRHINARYHQALVSPCGTLWQRSQEKKVTKATRSWHMPQYSPRKMLAMLMSFTPALGMNGLG